MDLTKTALGIELGSTRIKAVLIDEKHIPIASGDFEWENQLVNGIWTYSMDMVHKGVQTCFANLKADVKAKFGVALTTVGAIGISAMMHGYLPFDKDGNQLAEFRTWRNTITGEESSLRSSVPGATPSPARQPKSSQTSSVSTFPSAGVLRISIRLCSTGRSM